MKVIQLLNWKLNTIEKELENIKNQGFDAIQINPMQPFKEEQQFHWWSSYQPLGFRIGNMFGSKEDLKHLCTLASEQGIDIIVDVILNHMANKSDNEPLSPHSSVDKELLNEKRFWKEPIQLKNGDNRWEATHHCIGLPGLDLRNEDLQDMIFRYLDELKECGVSGFRFDAAKHIGLPNDGVNFFEKVREYLLVNDLYGYGEFLGGQKEWRDEMAKLLMVLSPYGTTLEDLNQLITFIESHDTYLNFGPHDNITTTRILTPEKLINAYRKVRNLNNNSIVYVRPNDENNEFSRNKAKRTIDEVQKLDEREYFTRLYFENPLIKEINNTQPKVLVKH